MLGRRKFNSFSKLIKCTNANFVKKNVPSKTIGFNNCIQARTKTTDSITTEGWQVGERKINKLGSPGISLENNTFQMFISTYPQIVEAVSYADDPLSDALKNFQKNCYYTGPNRELYATPALLNAYTALNEKTNLNSENLRLACVLAWCFEMTTTSIIVSDDILDNQHTRWKKPCLHKIVGSKTGIIVRLFHVFGYQLITKFFKNHPNYIPLINTFSDCFYKSYIGQDFDNIISSRFRTHRELEMISFAKYLTVLKYKIGFLMFKNPTLAAMYLSNNCDQEELMKLDNTLDKLTLHFQTMNDMWDCYGKYNTFGRIGTDIREGKCTWLSATALECMNNEQLQLFQQHYGVDHQKSEEIVKNIYEQIKIPEKYKQQKFQIRKELNDKKNQIPNSNVQNLLKSLLDTYVDINEDLNFN